MGGLRGGVWTYNVSWYVYSSCRHVFRFIIDILVMCILRLIVVILQYIRFFSDVFFGVLLLCVFFFFFILNLFLVLFFFVFLFLFLFLARYYSFPSPPSFSFF